MALDEVVALCEPTQVRHVMSVIEPQFQRDFIYLLPKEVSLSPLECTIPKLCIIISASGSFYILQSSPP